MIDLLRRHAAVLERALNYLRHAVADARVANPAFFTVVVDVAPGLAEVIDEVDTQHSLAEYLGDDLVATQQQGCGAIAVVQLLGAGGTGTAVVGGGQQHAARSTRGAGQGLRQASQGGALRAGDIHRAAVLADIQRLTNHGGIQPFGKRQGA
ncbi:hypothetical protein D9M70_593360 [compost metagenome]